MFVHDASNPDVEASILCLRHNREQQLLYANKCRFWVVIDGSNKPDPTPTSGLAPRFEHALRSPVHNDAIQEFSTIGCRVIETQVEDACQEMALLEAWTSPPDKRPAQLTIEQFRRGFLDGSISPWNHNEYLRAAYITLLDPENMELGLLEVASKFAADVDRFKQRNSQAQNQPESRTVTVFWLYHIRLAMSLMRAYQMNPEYYNFKRLLHYIPEMVDENLPTTHYSPDILKSEYSQNFWMLPNLRELIEPVQHPDLSFRERFTKTQFEDPERRLRFAFAVVQRYLRPGETRRRSWFINLAFSSLQQQTIQLRSTQPQVSAYSETQSYFYLQLVHAALAGLISVGGPELVQELSYPQFKATFNLSPSAWTDYYTPALWDSVPARAAFVPPDRKPLPDTMHAPKFWIGPTHHRAKANFHTLGLIPELPSPEILYFHRAILLEDAKPIPTPLPDLPPSTITTQAHLLKYIHTHLILPFPSPSTTPSTTLPHHLHHLTTTSPLPPNQITYYLHLLHTPNLQPPYAPPPPIRYHNCPCHAGEPVRWGFSPNAVDYPADRIQRLGLQAELRRGRLHGCVCHTGERVVGDLGRWWKEVVEKAEAGKGGGDGDGKGVCEEVDGGWKRGVEWEGWVRGVGGLVFCWDEAWKGGAGRVVVGREGGRGEGGEGRSDGEKDGDVDADEKTLRGEEPGDEGKENKGEGGEDGHADADEKTLRGEEGGEEDWEVVS
ncbi:hypothetical protein F5144DRAFT_600750 [Chaetomium tenue]|uniref:Uncharacterized protein n=1 Tax=Chaetomium tenue TaxID=1854479 RepID=A0ACB7PE90_9PEZI|nr:hypothetical protein F5144DRAFT_600750 [Chaetomium globosum]